MQIHTIHIALILILILIYSPLILILFIILIIYSSSPHHPSSSLIIRIIPSSSSSSTHHTHRTHHPLIVLVVFILLILTIIMGFWSLLYETNHPFQLALGSRAHGCCAARESSGSWGFRPGRRGPCFWRASTLYLFLQTNDEYMNGSFSFSVGR